MNYALIRRTIGAPARAYQRRITMKNTIKRFITDESGLETVEYAIIAGLITVGSIATIGLIGVWVSAKFTAVLDALNTG